ncbi:hypothetical protein SAMN04487971_1026 [Paracoccus chinensis]|uniref:Uncharacterized protein n=1 Tax=Paracoccus chinensis TaxID=525640 RepID=A0A1G9DDD1_9RHOB|nr:hypothetical protein SAMN04487971_1026 [Paracoccus chinensis]
MDKPGTSAGTRRPRTATGSSTRCPASVAVFSQSHGVPDNRRARLPTVRSAGRPLGLVRRGKARPCLFRQDLGHPPELHAATARCRTDRGAHPGRGALSSEIRAFPWRRSRLPGHSGHAPTDPSLRPDRLSRGAGRVDNREVPGLVGLRGRSIRPSGPIMRGLTTLGRFPWAKRPMCRPAMRPPGERSCARYARWPQGPLPTPGGAHRSSVAATSPRSSSLTPPRPKFGPFSAFAEPGSSLAHGCSTRGQAPRQPSAERQPEPSGLRAGVVPRARGA